MSIIVHVNLKEVLESSGSIQKNVCISEVSLFQGFKPVFGERVWPHLSERFHFEPRTTPQ